MRLLLTDLSESMTQAWQMFFRNVAGVKILNADITLLECDAIVSPANSFGFMDGGLDYAISERLGWQLQTELQQKIRQLPAGELLVGQSIVLLTGDAKIPYLISAPTMRVPMSFHIPQSVNAYLAMKAILTAAHAHDAIRTVAVPGLCTGVGKMDPVISARQMFIAWEEIVNQKPPAISNFGDAQKHQRNLNPQGMIFD